MQTKTRAVIIDCHCHAGKGDGLTGSWDTAAPLGKYMRWASLAGMIGGEQAVAVLERAARSPSAQVRTEPVSDLRSLANAALRMMRKV